MALRRNVGGADKTFRIALGLVLLGLAVFFEMEPVWVIVTLVLAAIALSTAFIGYCPVNQAVGIDSSQPKAGQQ